MFTAEGYRQKIVDLIYKAAEELSASDFEKLLEGVEKEVKEHVKATTWLNA